MDEQTEAEDLWGPVDWEHTDALEILVDGRRHFIGQKGSSYRAGKLEELAKLTFFAGTVSFKRIVEPDCIIPDP